jgi:hypothetical protein
MDAQKLQVKLFAEPTPTLKLEAFIPVLHGWIKHRVLPELMIDVANYIHVPQGPGVVLIGDGSDYFMDQGEGRLGLLYNRKRGAPAPKSRLWDAFRRTIHAALLLEREPAFGGKLTFRTDEWLFRINDRLHAPNDQETWPRIEPELRSFCSELFVGVSVDIQRVGGPSQLFAARIRPEAKADLPALLERLGGPP